MIIKEEKRGDVLILSLEGELMGGDETKEFQDKIYNSIREGIVNIVVDMKKLNWMNSAGLGTIMGGLTTLRGSGGDLRIANVSGRVRRPIEVTRLDHVIQIYEDVDQAVDSYVSGG